MNILTNANTARIQLRKSLFERDELLMREAAVINVDFDSRNVLQCVPPEAPVTLYVPLIGHALALNVDVVHST